MVFKLYDAVRVMNSLAELFAALERVNHLIDVENRPLTKNADLYREEFVDYLASIDNDPTYIWHDTLDDIENDVLYTKRVLRVDRGECYPSRVVPHDIERGNPHSAGRGSSDKFTNCNWSILRFVW